MTREVDSRTADGSQTDQSRRRVAVAWILVVVAASLVDPVAVLELIGASTTTGAGGTSGAGVFVVAHLVAYGVLAWLLVGGAGPSVHTRRSRAVLVAIAVATAVGVGVELLQAPVPARTASAIDALVNAVGATVGAGLRAAFGSR